MRTEVGNEQCNFSRLDKTIFTLYTLYFILAPFYFWQSGLPQVSDIIMVILLIVYLVKRKLRLIYNRHAKINIVIGVLFVAYVTIVNLSSTLVLGSYSSMLTKPMFYIYNILVVIFVLAMLHEYKNKLVELTFRSMFFALSLQVAIFVIEGGFTGERILLYFNNPNQLAYFSTLAFAILCYSWLKSNYSFKWVFVAIVFSSLLALASLSLLAVTAHLGIVLFFFLSRRRGEKIKTKISFAIVISLIVVIAILLITQGSTFITRIESRLDRSHEKLENIYRERGYYRITQYPEYWIFGAGEGNYFARFGSGLETHSTLGNIQVSYGLFGSLLFLSFLFLALKNDNFQTWYLLFFLILGYGLAHNGIRNTLLWILLAMMASGLNKKNSRFQISLLPSDGKEKDY